MEIDRSQLIPADAPLIHAPPLFTKERRQQIAQILGEQQRVTVLALSQQFAVSEVTIRKDLAWLEMNHLAVRTHGGAVSAANHTAEMGFEIREHLQQSEKERIGAMAASLVQDGETIALDASTTALCMTQFLKAKRELTVVTNGLRVGMELINTPGISVLIPGGMLRKESFSLIGTWGKSVLQNIHISKAFLGARGFSLDEGLTDVNSEEVELKRAVVESAREIVGIVDHSKWGQLALATFCPLDRLKYVITDTAAPSEMVEAVRQRGVEVRLA
ncbi:DeoR/GlpR family DNA-binding transcription regulator [Tengunoibacter tsumagoiensis]|uniref:DeoR family transcriptional regulator n=1 Tax=Tengunoibacter tsumagoiensis TaxID=2014871 RepID=A0A402A139_9CHLR|nr:DeoR/GlpR family DNA-binding transcription regulator [Tengunoibacter tsumagoiensis]GCE12880.1 DeoR family transcriptional regulator [Tengunoibacter tsumagoiensis]